MSKSPAVLLLDDGELDDVQSILETLGVAYGRVRGGAIVSDMAPPKYLLVSTPRRIDAVAAPDGEDDLSRIVVVSEDSPSLRSHLREIGFDYLVRRPVHPEALRLLLMHCLYRGEERRREPRVPMGFEISFDTGVASRRATLADLSSRGCRLLAGFAIDAGKRIKVQIPEALGATEPLTVEGRVLRMIFEPGLGEEGLYAAAVEFENLSRDARNELEWIIEDKSAGPPTLNETVAQPAPASDPNPPPTRRGKRRVFRETVSPSCPPDPRSEGSATHDIEPISSTPLGIPVDIKIAPPEPSEPRVEEPDDVTVVDRPIPATAAPTAQEVGPERRNTERRLYPEKVPAFGTRALRVLVGRDLSVGGMRIETQSELEIGDRLHLAIYGSPGEEPFLVWGTLVRKDGERGMAVEFDDVHPVIGEQLEKLIANLPAVESLHDDEASAMGTVLTEVLDG